MRRESPSFEERLPGNAPGGGIEAMKNGPIRLTNKTAIALRKSAKREKKVYTAAIILLTLLICAASVFVGVRYLIAVPVMAAAAVVLDVLLWMFARSRYLMLTSQAICTEAAAREIASDAAQEKRRKTAEQDLEKIREDARRAAQEEKESLPAQETAARRRRRPPTQATLKVIRGDQVK